jgi:hypothetical protein
VKEAVKYRKLINQVNCKGNQMAKCVRKEEPITNVSNALIDNKSNVAINGFGEEGCRSCRPK